MITLCVYFGGKSGAILFLFCSVGVNDPSDSLAEFANMTLWIQHTKITLKPFTNNNLQGLNFLKWAPVKYLQTLNCLSAVIRLSPVH